jgi:hypothetical protein
MGFCADRKLVVLIWILLYSCCILAAFLNCFTLSPAPRQNVIRQTTATVHSLCCFASFIYLEYLSVEINKGNTSSIIPLQVLSFYCLKTGRQCLIIAVNFYLFPRDIMSEHSTERSHNSVVGMFCGLRDTHMRGRAERCFPFPEPQDWLSYPSTLLLNVHPSSPGVKWLGCKASHLSPSI